MGDPNEQSDRDHLIRVAEVFGPTLQGEGPATGRPAMFVRLSGCNLACKWCDTPYTWDWLGRNGVAYEPEVEARQVLVSDIAAQILDSGCRLVVITGGEPMLQRRAVHHLASLVKPECEVHIETNGTIYPLADLVANIDLLVVSPKLAHSGDPENRRIKPNELAAYDATRRAVLKVVVSSPDDVGQVEGLSRLMPNSPVWIMPEGRSSLHLRGGLQALAPIAIAHGWNLSGRLHVDIWGDARGH